jgi:hypothetical protein
MQWTVLNSAVSLCGYWAAAALVDKPWYGRLRMQNYGFIMMFILFLICGAAFPQLTASSQGVAYFPVPLLFQLLLEPGKALLLLIAPDAAAVDHAGIVELLFGILCLC